MPEFSYTAFGLTIKSDIELPGFSEYGGICNVIIRKGHVPERIDNPSYISTHFETRPGTLLLRIHDVANFLIQDGVYVTYKPVSESQYETIKLYLLGSVIGTILMQRGCMPIHASAIEINGSAVLFAGSSGAGKSTLASEFVKRGYPLVTDDIAAISLNNSKIEIHPGLLHIKLWEDTIQQLNYSEPDLKQIRENIKKYYVPVNNIQNRTSLNVANIYILRYDDVKKETLIKLSGVSSFIALKDQIFKSVLFKGMDLEKVQFDFLTKLAAECTVSEIFRHKAHTNSNDLVSLVLKDLNP